MKTVAGRSGPCQAGNRPLHHERHQTCLPVVSVDDIVAVTRRRRPRDGSLTQECESFRIVRVIAETRRRTGSLRSKIRRMRDKDNAEPFPSTTAETSETST